MIFWSYYHFKYGPREYDILPSNIQTKRLQKRIPTGKKSCYLFCSFWTDKNSEQSEELLEGCKLTDSASVNVEEGEIN